MPETKSAPYTFVKQGIYYFSRRVPTDLSHHYKANRVMYSLRTRSVVVATSRAIRAAQSLNEHWYHLRLLDDDLPGRHLIRSKMDASEVGYSASTESSKISLLLSETVSVYICQKGTDRPAMFRRAAERACGYVIDTCGDKDLTAYTRSDENTFRDALIFKGLVGSSITQIFGTVRSVFNFSTAEIGISINNPFAGVYYNRQEGVEDRRPLPLEAIRSIQALCRSEDDDLRWLVAQISDTGTRLAEATGLGIDDIRLATRLNASLPVKTILEKYVI